MISRNSAWHLAALMLVLLQPVPARAATADLTAARLKPLPREGLPGAQTVGIADLAGDAGLVVYLWMADAQNLATSVVRPYDLGELRSLDGCQETPSTGKIISVVLVWPPDSQEKRESVYRAVQRTWRAEGWDLPVYVDVPDPSRRSASALYDAVCSAARDSKLPLPVLFRVQANPVAISEMRGNEPLRAGPWVSRLAQATPAPANRDAEEAGPWASSPFAHHAERVVTSLHIAALPDPQRPVTDAEFIELLRKMKPDLHVSSILMDYDPQKPQQLTRERAITATVRFLYGNDSFAALSACPPPSPPYDDWADALSHLPGAGNRSPGIENGRYLELALAGGLLYDQPGLSPHLPLSWGEAAWLLAHALVGRGRADATDGVLIDAVDIPLEPDPQFGRGRIYYVSGNEQCLYGPQLGTSDVPLPAAGYAPVLYVRAKDLEKRSGWLDQRVGRSRRPVTALRVRGRGLNARDVVISASDARAIMAQNKNTGALDDWRVAFVYGIGARLVEPDLTTQKVVSPATQFHVTFSVPMAAKTLTPETVRLESVSATGDAAPTGVELALVKSRPLDTSPGEVIATPTPPLRPGGHYRLLLGTGLESADGEAIDLPLTSRQRLPEGAVRCWEFTVDPSVDVRLYVEDAPPGAEAEVEGKRYTVAEGYPITFASAVGSRARVRVSFRGVDVTEQTVVVPENGEIHLSAPLPKPAGVTVTDWPAAVGAEEEARFTVHAVDADGNRLAVHQPVAVWFRGDHLRFTPSAFSLQGEAAVAVSADSLGLFTATIVHSVSGGRPEPRKLPPILCRSKTAPRDPVMHSPEFPVPEPASDPGLTRLSPAWRRWLMRGIPSSRQIRVTADATGARKELTPVQGPDAPLQGGQYRLDPQGYVYVLASTRPPVELDYLCPQGLGALVVVGAGPGSPAPPGVRAQFAALLEELGYQLAPESDMTAVSGRDYGPEGVPGEQKVEVALKALNLDEVFVVQVVSPEGNGRSGRRDIKWTIWSAGDGGPDRWQPLDGTGAPRSVRLQTRGGRELTFDPGELRAATASLLEDWLKQVGLSFPVTRPARNRGYPW